VHPVLKVILYVPLGVICFIITWLLVARVVRHFWKFPMPQIMANVIDNPLRRRLQPPLETAIRHGLEPGMRVLEVGPGNGTYTVGAAQRVGDGGEIVAVDIEPHMVERVRRRMEAEGITNVEVRVADVYDLPFDENSFDAGYMIAVIGEILEPVRAMREIRRVLKPDGTLALSEILPDPDYPRSGRLLALAQEAGFRLRRKVGNVLYYTLILEKSD
jgi:ubiquinone/menaquinone biosynthesis C-methylase UbiE